jgi:hypothetical protein
MHLKSILLGLIGLALGLTTYGYVNDSFISTRTVTAPMRYYVQSRPDKSTSPTELKNAKTLADIIEDYPRSWITDYDSVIVLTTSNGRQQKSIGKSEISTEGQKLILSSADMSSVIDIYVMHKTKNSVTQELEDGEMYVKLAVRPETEAEYSGGLDVFTSYLQQNSEAKVKELSGGVGFVAIANFTINEDGVATDIDIAESSAYSGVNEVLEQLLKDMPVWLPAKDAKGENVSQEFEIIFGFGTQGGC